MYAYICMCIYVYTKEYWALAFSRIKTSIMLSCASCISFTHTRNGFSDSFRISIRFFFDYAESHVLRHSKATDVLLLGNHGDCGGCFAQLSGNVYDPLTCLILADNFILHFNGYGHLFGGKLRRFSVKRHNDSQEESS